MLSFSAFLHTHTRTTACQKSYRAYSHRCCDASQCTGSEVFFFLGCTMRSQEDGASCLVTSANSALTDPPGISIMRSCMQCLGGQRKSAPKYRENARVTQHKNVTSGEDPPEMTSPRSSLAPKSSSHAADIIRKRDEEERDF